MRIAMAVMPTDSKPNSSTVLPPKSSLVKGMVKIFYATYNGLLGTIGLKFAFGINQGKR
jgi:hypothetical protein